MAASLDMLLLATLVFIGSHVLLSATPVRASLIEWLGQGRFHIVYSAAAVITLIWLFREHGRAPYIELWPAWAWTYWVPIVVMPFASILLVAGLTTRSPTSLVGDESLANDPSEDPAPGILKITRHPVMWALALWAFAHVPPNGDAASLIMFGALGGLALAGMGLIDYKREQTLGSAWGPVVLTTSSVPFRAIAEGRTSVGFAEIGWTRILGGIALYLALFVLHPLVIGASPLGGT